MSTLTMTQTEEKSIDSQIEQMMDWARTRTAEAEQLALDSARLMACTTDRLGRLKNQGFFQRCWNRFSGKAGEMERANTNDLIQMQKTAFRYVNMLQEQQLLMAHSLLSLKNNLISLAVQEEETRNLIAMLAQRTLDRFEKLENRVDQLEISTNLQGWLLGLEEREYDEKIPTEFMRLLRVINDFYQIKRDNWNYNDLIFMRKAIRTVGLNPKQKISLNSFIDKLTDEIQTEDVGFDAYGQAITMFPPKNIENYSKYAIENISSPVFVSLHALKIQYMDRLDIVEELQDEMNISAGEALKRLLRRSINNMNVNLDYAFPLAEAAIEILGCLRLIEKISDEENNEENDINTSDSIIDTEDTDSEEIASDDSTSKQNTDDKQNEDDDAEEKAREATILAYFGALSPTNSLYIKGRYNNDKVCNKLQSGLSSFGLFTDEDEVLVYFDSTLFGGGDEGFILTHDTIYFKNSGDADYEDYDSIDRVISNWGGFVLDMGWQKHDLSCVDNDARDATVAALRAMQKYSK